MRMAKKYMTALAAALFIAAVPATSYGAVVYKASSNSTYSEKEKDKKEADKEAKGPGAVTDELLEEVTASFTGPSVKKVDLREHHHDTYDTYELSIEDLFFLYSNVGNGGITHEPVSIDIPANIIYTMEKDGLPYPYVSKQTVSEKGTYVLRLTAVENPDLPMSEQTEYQAVYRFRIADKPKEESLPDGFSGVTESSVWGEAEKEAAKDLAVMSEPLKEEEVKEDKADTEETAEEAAAGGKSEENAESEVTGEAEELPSIDSSTQKERTHVYNAATGYYETVLENGVRVTSNVPEGYIGAASVELILSEGDAARAKLYKDDTEVTFTNRNGVMENGSYRLEVGGCSYHFAVDVYVSALEYYPAPAGMEFTEIYFNDTVLPLESERYVELANEGTYEIHMRGLEGNQLSSILIKDHTAPEVTVTLSSGNASIQYIAEDIKEVRLFKNGELVQGFTGTSITTPGTYHLEAEDEAGNVTVKDFSLKYQINFYGILAVFLCIAVLAGIVVFVLHTKKNMKIR